MLCLPETKSQISHGRRGLRRLGKRRVCEIVQIDSLEEGRFQIVRAGSKVIEIDRRSLERHRTGKVPCDVEAVIPQRAQRMVEIKRIVYAEKFERDVRRSATIS